MEMKRFFHPPGRENTESSEGAGDEGDSGIALAFGKAAAGKGREMDSFGLFVR